MNHPYMAIGGLGSHPPSSWWRVSGTPSSAARTRRAREMTRGRHWAMKVAQPRGRVAVVRNGFRSLAATGRAATTEAGDRRRTSGRRLASRGRSGRRRRRWSAWTPRARARRTTAGTGPRTASRSVSHGAQTQSAASYATCARRGRRRARRRWHQRFWRRAQRPMLQRRQARRRRIQHQPASPTKGAAPWRARQRLRARGSVCNSCFHWGAI